MKLIRSELYKILHSKINWGITAALLVLSFWMLNSRRLSHAGGYEFMLFLWQNPLPMMWIGVALAVGSFGSSFPERTWNGAIYKGNSRIWLFAVRAFYYYLWGLLIQLAVITVLLTRYQAWSEVLKLGAEILLPRMLLHLLAMLALLTPPLLISFLLRDLFGSMAVSSGLVFLLQNLLGQGEENVLGELAERFYPAAQMLNLNLWVGMDETAVWRLATLCLAYLIVGGAGAAAAFWVSEMK